MTTQIKLVAFILFACFMLSASVRADQVDDYILSQITERNVPGVAAAVILKGRIVKIKGYGLASVEFNAPVTTETVFEIGSVSKQMTAAGIILLVEDGKLGLDEKISNYLPNTPEAWQNVTVRQLLTHTSGVKSYSSLDGFELSRRVKIDGFIKQLSPYPLEFTPGDRNIYSNSGYNLLAYIIETQSGRPYIDFMRERIFRPLGMTKTGDRDPQFIIKNRATGYEWRQNRLTGRDGNLTDLMGAGSIVSTIADMAKWDAALRGSTFLKPESKLEKWKQFAFNDGKPSPYGFGWRITDIRGHKRIGHTGQTAGFGAANFRYADDDVTVIVLTNLGEIGLGGQIAARIAKFYIPAISLRRIPSKPEVSSVSSAKVLTILRSRAENNFDPALLSDELTKALSTERAKAAYRRVAAVGMPTNVVFVGSEGEGEKTVYRFVAETGKRLFLWRIALDGDGKISEMEVEEDE